MATSLTLGAHHHDGRHVLAAAGEIDLSNVDVFKDALAAAVATAADGGDALIVDLGAVEYLDSSAINVLYEWADHIETIIAHALLVSLLSVSGLSELVAVQPASPTPH